MLRKVLATSLLISSGLAYPTDSKHRPNATSLEWAPCDLDFPSTTQIVISEHREPLFCANLSVPLDYTNSGNGKTIDLQLIKVKANKEPFRGSVLTNPGGPGGSGVDWIAVEGPSFRNDLGGYHDVIGFDPRYDVPSKPSLTTILTMTVVVLVEPYRFSAFHQTLQPPRLSALSTTSPYRKTMRTRRSSRRHGMTAEFTLRSALTHLEMRTLGPTLTHLLWPVTC